MAPGKYRTLIVPSLHSLSLRIWNRTESSIIKVVPLFHVRVSSTISSNFGELECAMSSIIKLLFLANFLAFSISVLHWSIVLSMVYARWRFSSLRRFTSLWLPGALIGALSTSTASTVFLLSPKGINKNTQKNASHKLYFSFDYYSSSMWQKYCLLCSKSMKFSSNLAKDIL